MELRRRCWCCCCCYADDSRLGYQMRQALRRFRFHCARYHWCESHFYLISSWRNFEGFFEMFPSTVGMKIKLDPFSELDGQWLLVLLLLVSLDVHCAWFFSLSFPIGYDKGKANEMKKKKKTQEGFSRNLKFVIGFQFWSAINQPFAQNQNTKKIKPYNKEWLLFMSECAGIFEAMPREWEKKDRCERNLIVSRFFKSRFSA